MSAITIRAVSLSDLDAIVALERAVFSSDRLSRRSLRAFATGRRSPFLVATLDNRLAGYALVVIHPRRRAARLYSIAVDPAFGRRGIGRALIAACERASLDRGRDALRLEVREDNGAAIALYRRMGYRQFDAVEAYYADGATALRFELELRPEPRALRK